MTITTPSAALVLVEQEFSDQERLALAGFLAGYSGLTREAYALDLRQFAAWCHRHQLHLFGVRRADIERFGRDLEAAGGARATVTRQSLPAAQWVTKPAKPLAAVVYPNERPNGCAPTSAMFHTCPRRVPVTASTQYIAQPSSPRNRAASQAWSRVIPGSGGRSPSSQIHVLVSGKGLARRPGPAMCCQPRPAAWHRGASPYAGGPAEQPLPTRAAKLR